MRKQSGRGIVGALLVGGLVAACNANPAVPGLTSVPTLAPGLTPTLVAALSGAVSSPTASGGGTQAIAAVGAALFEQNCSPCHGQQGEGVSGPALRNNPYIRTAGDDQVFATIAGGRPGTSMPAWLQSNAGPLTSPQISDVVAFLHSLQNVSVLPSATPVSATEEATATALPANAPTPEPASPSNPGGPGQAVSLQGNADSGRGLFGQDCAACHGPEGVQGKPNPGSDDGSVPVLNPIDPTIANADPKIFATNADLFVQHGSVPSGASPLLMMPPFGDQSLLTQQQIADVIAYVMSLNGVK